jgi:transposase InsO family protein
MKRSRFSEEQVAYALRQVEAGTPVGDACRQLGVSEATFYAWKKEVCAPRRERAPAPPAAGGRKRALEATRRRSHTRQTHAVRGAAKTRLRPVRRRELAGWSQATFQVSCARACRLAQFSRAAWYRRSRARDQSALRLRIRELAHARPRFGYLRILDRLLAAASRPRSITVDHGTEFQSRALEDWAYRRGVELDFIRPGKPVENAFIESFNGRPRDGCLNVHQFTSITDAQAKIEAWRLDYNQRRPHGSLGHLTPNEFITQRQAMRPAEAVAFST